jgi:hypothetical protein
MEEAAELGPSLFPRLISICLIILSLVLITVAILRKETGNQEPKPRRGLRLPLLIFTMTIGYVILLYVAGFFISTSVFFLSVALTLKARLKPTILFTGCLTLAAYLVFRILLKVPLPIGVIFGGL